MLDPVNNKLSGEDGMQHNLSSTVADASIAFDPAHHVSYWPKQFFSDYKSGLVGGHLRISSFGCFDMSASAGFETMTVAPMINGTHQVLIRLNETTTAGTNLVTYFAAPEAGNVVELPANQGSTLFFTSIYDEYEAWSSFFETGATFTLPSSERRQTDMAHAAIVSAVTNFVGGWWGVS